MTYYYETTASKHPEELQAHNDVHAVFLATKEAVTHNNELIAVYEKKMVEQIREVWPT